MSENKLGELRVIGACPKCGTNLDFIGDITLQSISPRVRGNLKPLGNILVYKITFEDMRTFIIQKAKQYCPDAKVEVVPRYCEKKRRRENEPHRSYASLRIGFSEHVIDKNSDLGWYGKIGESSDNMRIKQSMFQNIIQKYKYNLSDIENWKKSYKTLEELEDNLGMTEAYINDLQMYANPRRIRTNGGDDWIVFSAAAENVLSDMLTDPHTCKVPGKIQIQDVYPISKDNVEFIVYLHPIDMELRDNPHVRQILLGEEKPKKD